MQPAHRPAVRIVCLDLDGRVLLLNWRDPHDGSRLWEPPGGGIDPGESPLETARRELVEETGLDPAVIHPDFLVVERDTMWKGRRWTGPEQFFVARYPLPAPEISRAGLLPYEQTDLITHAWIHPAGFPTLPDRLEPPSLATICKSLPASPT
jgi:8-oxo-dGTP pyrophosphatase MutT (NUDIX family)